jgi:DedD protein
MIELRFSDRSSPLRASWRCKNALAEANPIRSLRTTFNTFRMGLFSFLRKNKQEASPGDSGFYSRAEEDAGTARSSGTRRRRKQGKAAESDDPVLPEKKRARRRLVGAVALVLAAVIGLPMLLDSEPKPVADDIAIQIPSKDKPVPPASVPAPPAASRVNASAALDKKEEMVEIPPPVAAAPAQTEAAAAPKENKPANTKPAEVSKSVASVKAAVANPAKGDSKNEAKPETPSKPQVSKPAEKTDDARAVALLEGKSDAKPTTDKNSEKIVIQVGAFATKEKIDEVRNKLKKAGIQTFTQKVATGSGERTRVRVGPLASKEEADKVRAKLAKLGFDAKTVTGEY